MSERSRVLLVEDDDATLETFATALREAGFAVWVARDGTAAMEVAEELDWSADVLVVDLRLGEGPRGDQFVAYWRTRSKRDTPVIVVTALERGRELAKPIRAAIVRPKPVGVDELVSAVRLFARPPRQNSEGTD